MSSEKPGPGFEKRVRVFFPGSMIIKTGLKLSITYDKKLGIPKMMPKINYFAAIAFL